MNFTKALGAFSATALPLTNNAIFKTCAGLEENLQGSRLQSINGQNVALKPIDIKYVNQIERSMRTFALEQDRLTSSDTIKDNASNKSESLEVLFDNLTKYLTKTADTIISTCQKSDSYSSEDEEDKDRYRIRCQTTGLDTNIKNTFNTIDKISQTTGDPKNKSLSDIKLALHEIIRDRIIYLNGIP